MTIAPVSPCIAGEGELSRYFHYYLGWRHDEISINNRDLVNPANSFTTLVRLNSPFFAFKDTFSAFAAEWFLLWRYRLRDLFGR